MERVPCSASITNDVTVAAMFPPWVATLHAYAGVGPSLPTFPNVEFPEPMLYVRGAAKHKFATTVAHKGKWIAQEGHDLGMMQLHVSVPPTNALDIVHTIFSSRAVAYSSFGCKVGGQRIGAADSQSMLPLQMMTCMDPITLPVGQNVTAWLNSLDFGMSFTDYAVGVVVVAASMVIDGVTFHKSLKKGGPKLPLGREIRDKVGSKLLGGGDGQEVGLKRILAIASSATKNAIAGDSQKVPIGGPFYSAEYDTKTGKTKHDVLGMYGYEDGEWTDKAAENLSHGAGPADHIIDQIPEL